MKLTLVFTFMLATLVAAKDVAAQGRGPRHNPNPGSGSSTSGGSSGGHPRGPSYNPNQGGGASTPTRPSTTGGYSPQPRPTEPSRPTGPRYNPNPGPSTPPSRGGGYNPSSRPTEPSRPNGPRYNPNPGHTTPPATSSGYNPNPRPTGPRYNPNPGHSTPPATSSGYNPNPRPTGPRYNPNSYRPSRTHYDTRSYHRPHGYTPITYVHYYHAPYSTPYYHHVRFYRSFDWYNYVWSSYPTYVYAHWIFFPAMGYNNGYWTIDNYPYYVFNGYRYRYSSYDYCNYQLVDKWNHRVERTYWNQLCNYGYDNCAYERDRLNAQMGEFRYFCSETYRDMSFDYSTPSYDDTCVDNNRDGMCDDYVPQDNTCWDRDQDGYCDNF
jgi:hypothetical protein